MENLINNKLLGLMGICLFSAGCVQKFDSEKVTKSWKNEVDLKIVVTDKGRKSRDFTLYGKRLDNNHDTTFEEYTGYLVEHYEDFHIGDTVIKPKGKYNMIIKGRHGNKNFPFSFNDKDFADTLTVTK